LTFGNIVIDGM